VQALIGMGAETMPHGNHVISQFHRLVRLKRICINQIHPAKIQPEGRSVKQPSLVRIGSGQANRALIQVHPAPAAKYDYIVFYTHECVLGLFLDPLYRIMQQEALPTKPSYKVIAQVNGLSLLLLVYSVAIFLQRLTSLNEREKKRLEICSKCKFLEHIFTF
jgi:hypothetical protein